MDQSLGLGVAAIASTLFFYSWWKEKEAAHKKIYTFLLLLYPVGGIAGYLFGIVPTEHAAMPFWKYMAVVAVLWAWAVWPLGILMALCFVVAESMQEDDEKQRAETEDWEFPPDDNDDLASEPQTEPDDEFAYDPSGFDGAADAAPDDDEKLWNMAQDPRTPEPERQNAMRAIQRRNRSNKRVSHSRA